jgi:hypothetical protein
MEGYFAVLSRTSDGSIGTVAGERSRAQGRAMGANGGTTMIEDEPDADTWRRLFASLTGDPATDAAVIREFCAARGVTPAQVMAAMQAHRRTVQPQE